MIGISYSNIKSNFLYWALILASSCQTSVPFNKTDWLSYNAVDGTDRSTMTADLLQNHKIIGRTNKQVVNLLGEPSGRDTTEAFYELSVKYDMIDPVSGKDLVIIFNKDSIVTKAFVKEWKKHN